MSVDYYITTKHDSTLQTNACSYFRVMQQTIKISNISIIGSKLGWDDYHSQTNAERRLKITWMCYFFDWSNWLLWWVLKKKKSSDIIEIEPLLFVRVGTDPWCGPQAGSTWGCWIFLSRDDILLHNMWSLYLHFLGARKSWIPLMGWKLPFKRLVRLLVKIFWLRWFLLENPVF